MLKPFGFGVIAVMWFGLICIVIAIALDYWTYFDNDSINIHAGLWRLCTEVKSTSNQTCTSVEGGEKYGLMIRVLVCAFVCLSFRRFVCLSVCLYLYVTSSVCLPIRRTVIWFVRRSVNPFPNKQCFLRICITRLLKTPWEKEKLLVTINFSFSHSVFYFL